MYSPSIHLLHVLPDRQISAAAESLSCFALIFSELSLFSHLSSFAPVFILLLLLFSVSPFPFPFCSSSTSYNLSCLPPGPVLRGSYSTQQQLTNIICFLLFFLVLFLIFLLSFLCSALGRSHSYPAAAAAAQYPPHAAAAAAAAAGKGNAPTS